jgi:hypothetical protein
VDGEVHFAEVEGFGESEISGNFPWESQAKPPAPSGLHEGTQALLSAMMVCVASLMSLAMSAPSGSLRTPQAWK